MIESLKKSLKLKGISYKKLAKMMELSKPTIDKMFSKGVTVIPLDRFLKICEVIEVPIEEVISRGKVDAVESLMELNLEQEKFMVKNLPYLAFLALLRVHQSTEKIAEIYNLNKGTVVAIMAKLDKWKIIKWLPGEEFKMLVRLKFLEDGPISKLLKPSKLPEYFQGDFDGVNEYQYFNLYNFSESTLNIIKSKFEEHSKEIEILKGLDRTMSEKVSAAGIHLSIRHFNPPFFEELRNFEVKS